jgi:hypothetical protein
VEIRMLGNTRQVPFVTAWVKLCLQWGAVIATRDPAFAISAIIHGRILETQIEAIREAKRSIEAANRTAVAAVTGDSPRIRPNETVREHQRRIYVQQQRQQHGPDAAEDAADAMSIRIARNTIAIRHATDNTNFPEQTSDGDYDGDYDGTGTVPC